jgi:putative hemolysin
MTLLLDESARADIRPDTRPVGRLEVRLARDAEEIIEAQALRFRIFHEECGAESAEARRLRLDSDSYDAVCDHLLVLEHGAADARPRVVGTYRLLRQSVAARHQGFYSASEFDLTPLIRASETRGQLLELGRSCVAPEYRSSGTINLLWRGIASYLAEHAIGLLFGCASFPGTDPAPHAAELSLLAHAHRAPAELRATAITPGPLALLAPGSYDPRLAARALPPLVRGYLRVGAVVGDGVHVDQAFNTVDVLMVMPVAAMTQRYLDRFGAGATA